MWYPKKTTWYPKGKNYNVYPVHFGVGSCNLLYRGHARYSHNMIFGVPMLHSLAATKFLGLQCTSIFLRTFLCWGMMYIVVAVGPSICIKHTFLAFFFVIGNTYANKLNPSKPNLLAIQLGVVMNTFTSFYSLRGIYST